MIGCDGLHLVVFGIIEIGTDEYTEMIDQKHRLLTDIGIFTESLKWIFLYPAHFGVTEYSS